MEWIDAIQEAINFMEEHITEELSAKDVSDHVHISHYYFQKGFHMLCGYSVAEYIRNRRLALAGSELASTDRKIIDIALQYGYDSPDSFTKAFTRFHGVSKEQCHDKNFCAAEIRNFIERRLSYELQNC